MTEFGFIAYRPLLRTRTLIKYPSVSRLNRRSTVLVGLFSLNLKRVTLNIFLLHSLWQVYTLIPAFNSFIWIFSWKYWVFYELWIVISLSQHSSLFHKTFEFVFCLSFFFNLTLDLVLLFTVFLFLTKTNATKVHLLKRILNVSVWLMLKKLCIYVISYQLKLSKLPISSI